MNDKSFLDTFIAERMQMHYYSMRHGNTANNELTDSLKLEEGYTHVMETLPTAARETIDNFVKDLNNKAASDETFFYRKGVKDGLLLYELLTKL